MKLIIPDVVRECYLAGYKVREIKDKINELQKAAGLIKKPISTVAIREYNHKTPPQERVYALCAILGKHPSKVFKIKYDEEKFKYYQDLFSKISQ